MKVHLFIPCFIDQVHPEVGQDMVKVLQHIGCEVEYNPNQTCCGQPAFNAGFWEEARQIGKKFIHDFTGNNFIVAPGASCVGFIRNYYMELFANSNDHNALKEIQNNIFEFSEFLVDILKVDNIGSKLNTTATYHDACAALRECGIKKSPRILLNNIEGLQWQEMNDCETCCGFGGTFTVKFEPISVGMADNKINNALATNTNYIISTDQSCLMHLQSYIDKQQKPIKTIHLASILAKGL